MKQKVQRTREVNKADYNKANSESYPSPGRLFNCLYPGKLPSMLKEACLSKTETTTRLVS